MEIKRDTTSQLTLEVDLYIGCVGFPNRCNKTATAATITLSTSCRSCCTGRALYKERVLIYKEKTFSVHNNFYILY